jgi:propanol-preferring alcohol dehydrogenase
VQGVGGLGISVFNLRGKWDSVPLRLGGGATRRNLQRILGAHVYIDAAAEDAVAVLQRMGGARAILATGTRGDAMGRLVPGLVARGKLIVVGAPEDQIQLSALLLLFGGRSVCGSLTGTPIEAEDTFGFSVPEKEIDPLLFPE